VSGPAGLGLGRPGGRPPGRPGDASRAEVEHLVGR
jgi:hypothetical protein